MRSLFIVGIAGVLAVPFGAGAAPEPASTYDLVLQGLLETFGFVPPTAVVNGVERPSEEVLAMLRANSLPLPHADPVYLPGRDVGVGIRAGSEACRFAVYVVAVASGPSLQEAMEGVQRVGAPGGSFACMGPQEWVRGVASGSIAATASYRYACATPIAYGLGAFVNEWTCHFNDFASAEVAGDVGVMDVVFNWGWTYYHLEQLFAGVVGTGPRDVGVVEVEA